MPIFGGAFHALKKIWKEKKDKFKNTTGESKPSKKALGFIRLSAGLEPALVKIDDTSLAVWTWSTSDRW